MRVPMDPLDFLTQEELIKFFHCKKTEMSCMEDPRTFLNQLRDHNLVPDHLYKKVIKMKSKERKQGGVYEILDWVEKKQSQHVNRFWRCMFKDHILQKYRVFHSLRNSLLDGSFKFYENLPEIEEPKNNENESIQKDEKKLKGRGKRKKSAEETEEEEEPGPSSCSTPSRKKAARKPTFSTPLKKGEKAAIWMWDLYKTTLPVTCGDKEGTLYRDKLARGIKCILSNGEWFTPNDFEKFAGMGKWKNWKLSIRCLKSPLQKLIKENHLKCPAVKRRCVRKRVLFPVSSSESSSPQSESSVEMEGSNEDQEEEEREVDGDQEEQEEESEEQEESEEEVEEEQEEGNEEEAEPVDLSEFEAAVLPVGCGSVTGDLYRNRFVGGSRSKSIRTEERWFTPEEFIKQESALTDGHWKKDILCHGKTLDYLVKNKILYIHSLLCKCDLCCPEDPLAQNNDDVCFICGCDGDKYRKLVCCDECPQAFHQDCHLPTPQNDRNEDKWLCTFCVWKIYKQMLIPMSLEGALKSAVTQNIMRCEYLLLCLYKEDTQRMFADNPSTTESGSVILKPMWLDRVKSKLQRKNYNTVGEFVNDVRLIFQNCQTFNQGNEFGMMGARLSETFEQMFRIVFKIQ